MGYFKIADRYNIIDQPNHRSSHRSITIRGGGIIFPIAFLIPLCAEIFTGWFLFSIGLLGISVISFLDDVLTLNNKTRLLIQSLSVILLMRAGQFDMNHLLAGTFFFVLIMGIVNAYNFMDGINGITSLYSIITIGSLFWVNSFMIPLVPGIFFTSILASLLVFLFFNMRKKAICFAGDVGSVSMAFIICFLLVRLAIKTHSFIWVLFLGVYGIDTVVTIFCRLIRKEPIFRAHRSHFYQFLANELKISHLVVSLLYALAQFLLNCVVIASFETGLFFIAWIGLFVFLLVYVIFRFRFEGWHRLFRAY